MRSYYIHFSALETLPGQLAYTFWKAAQYCPTVGRGTAGLSHPLPTGISVSAPTPLGITAELASWNTHVYTLPFGGFDFDRLGFYISLFRVENQGM